MVGVIIIIIALLKLANEGNVSHVSFVALGPLVRIHVPLRLMETGRILLSVMYNYYRL